MIQRIQTLYLLAAAVFMVLFYLFPIAIFTTDTFAFEFFNCRLTHPENLKPPITLVPLAILPLLSIVLSMTAIFMFKKRKLQMRLGKLNMLILLTVMSVGVFYLYRIGGLLGGDVSYGYSGIFPVVTFVIIIMANRAIKSDDDLVRAADRIR